MNVQGIRKMQRETEVVAVWCKVLSLLWFFAATHHHPLSHPSMHCDANYAEICM